MKPFYPVPVQVITDLDRGRIIDCPCGAKPGAQDRIAMREAKKPGGVLK
ncbi:MAG: hypothetical protein ACTS6J_14320 [Burkholderiales bacterium]